MLFQSARSAFRALTLVALLFAVVATIYGGRVGLFVAQVSFGAHLMLLALWVASHGPMWSGGIPGVLGAILGAPGGALEKLGALIGALLILIWAALDRRTAVLRSDHG